MADSSREAGQQKLRKKLPTDLSTGLFGNGSDRMGSDSPDLEIAAGARRVVSVAHSRHHGAMPRAGMARIRFIAGCHPDVRIRVAFLVYLQICGKTSSRDLFACNGTGAFASTNSRQAFEPVRGACLTGQYPGLPCFGVQLCIPRRRSRHSSWPPTPHLPRPWRTGFGPCRGSGSGIPCPSTPRPTRARSPRPTAKSKPRCGRLFRSSTRARHFGEEYGVQQAEAEFVWSLDPIDGTRAFISGNPCGAPCWRCCIGASRCWA